MSPSHLHVQLECELPDKLAVGRGTALFICGWGFSREQRIQRLDFLLNGDRQPVAAHSMPRLDPFRVLHPTLDPAEAALAAQDPDSDEDPHLHSYRSGFWGMVEVAPELDGQELVLSLEAELADGERLVEPLGRISCRAPERPLAVTWPDGSTPRVAIAMATYNPPADLLRAQLDSIRDQSHTNWVCVISDDGSGEAGRRVLEEAIGDDERFLVSHSPRQLGFYRNFERALELVPDDAEFVALADQDDSWFPDKLTTLLAERGNAELVYSDARVVSRDGKLVADTWWDKRRNNHDDLLSLLVANAVTGAASLFERRLLDYALPFPPAQFAHFHDHWIGLVAACRGRVEYVDRPLYDYVQHGQASLGHAAANQMTSLLERLRAQRQLAERVRWWRLHYFVDVARLNQFATILCLRCGTEMAAGRRRVLRRFLAAEGSPLELVRLALRGLRELMGTPETLGAEWMLFWALLWRRLLQRSVRDRPQARWRLDALPPPTLIQSPGAVGLPEPVAEVQRKIAPLSWAVSEDAPQRINLLIPSIDLQHLFGGYIAKFNLAARLSGLGYRVRIITVDPVGPLSAGWRSAVESYRGLEGLFEKVELAFGREAPQLEVSRRDGFIATTWWTAHIAWDALRTVDAERFLYLIQEYEPFTFPMGSYAALATGSYEFPHRALFSSELLRSYFREHRIGVYGKGPRTGDRGSAAFQNAITPVPPPSEQELAQRDTCRLLFYGRPEPHAARNMFELGVLGLAAAARQGVLDGWDLDGIGSVGRGDSISLGAGQRLTLLPRASQSSYAEMLRDHDVGVALMYTPHPSLVPIEMASAGMVTVTNTFEVKTADAMREISPNLLCVPPTVEGVAQGLASAVSAVRDFEARSSGSRVRWSSDWSESFSDELLTSLAHDLWPS